MNKLELITNIRSILEKRVRGIITLKYTDDNYIVVDITTQSAVWRTAIADVNIACSPFAQAYVLATSIIAEYRRDILSQFLK